MALGNKIHKEVPQDLRKQLALGVRSIQWSYAIFWSISSRQPGVLEWVDGYYNGEIKTRKTVQAAETDADQLGLQRSDQLRELFESLSLGETNSQSKRPTAALSPEDLTDAEWYFLVCMSFVFNDDQGLPGRTFAKNQTIWLCNAHRSDTKVFSRSLLAKSASIQTIVCFPHFGGVIELGTTKLIPEDLSLIQRVRNSFLGSPSATEAKIPNHVTNHITNVNDRLCDVLDCANAPEDSLDQILDCPEIDICSPNDSNEFADNLLNEDPNLLEGTNGEASQMQHWPFMDDTVSNCLNNSMTSSDCVSQTYRDPEAIVLTSDRMQEPNGGTRDAQQGSQQNTSGFQGNENHYHSVLSNLLKSSHQLILGPYFKNGHRQSSFVSWRRDGLPGARVPHGGTHQRLLKKVLFEVARMHENFHLESGKQKRNAKPEADEIDRNHVLSERKRREKINERFTILGSLVPSGGKVDKVSILDHTIEYLRKLERKVDELESNKETMALESMTRPKPHDAIERTSDNYGPTKASNTKKPLTNKRKACDMDKSGPESSKVHLRDPPADSITVNVSDKDVLIEISCSWKDCVMIDIMEAVSKLRMESETVQSSNTDGILSMTIKAKSKGLKSASANVIREALMKVIRKN